MKENLSTVGINKIKVHYFFSEEMDINKFLTETEIKVILKKIFKKLLFFAKYLKFNRDFN